MEAFWFWPHLTCQIPDIEYELGNNLHRLQGEVAYTQQLDTPCLLNVIFLLLLLFFTNGYKHPSVNNQNTDFLKKTNP